MVQEGLERHISRFHERMANQPSAQESGYTCSSAMGKQEQKSTHVQPSVNKPRLFSTSQHRWFQQREYCEEILRHLENQ